MKETKNSVESVDLRYNEIYDESAFAIFNAVVYNHRIKSLDLRENPISKRNFFEQVRDLLDTRKDFAVKLTDDAPEEISDREDEGEVSDLSDEMDNYRDNEINLLEQPQEKICK